MGGRHCPGGRGEKAIHIEGLYFDGSRDLAQIAEGPRINESKRNAVVIGVIFPGDLFSIDGAGDLAILVLRLAGSRDRVAADDQIARLVAFTAADVRVNGPRPRQVLRCENRGGNKERGCCEKSLHHERPFGLLEFGGRAFDALLD